MTPEEFAERFPDHETLVYRNTAVLIEGWPNGFECLIAVPKAKLRALRNAGMQPPFWRKGEVMHVRPPEVDGGCQDQGAPGSLRSADGSGNLSEGAA